MNDAEVRLTQAARLRRMPQLATALERSQIVEAASVSHRVGVNLQYAKNTICSRRFTACQSIAEHPVPIEAHRELLSRRHSSSYRTSAPRT
jgi:hypothetical protein